MVDEDGGYDKEVLFEFIRDYAAGKYNKNNTTEDGTFYMSFEKNSDNECGEYVYRYTTIPREGEFSLWIMVGRDYNDGRVKIIQMGKAG